MKKHCYEVRHEVKHGKHASDLYRYNVEADTAKEAIQIAKELWYKSHFQHMFNVLARRVNDAEVIDWCDYFKRV